MEILLIRHGEMEFEEGADTNLELVNAYATGAKQGPLSARGVSEARRVAEVLAAWKPQALYSSAFIRARQTAEETAKVLGTPVRVLTDFGEVNVGRLDPEHIPFQAMTLKAIDNLHRVLPAVIGRERSASLLEYFFILFYFRSWHAGRTVAAESLEGALGRIRSVFEEVQGLHLPAGKIAVFTHGYFIHLLVNRVLDRRGALARLVRNPYIRNGSITHLVRSAAGDWKVQAYADAGHLA